MRLTIIIKVFNFEKLRKSLNILINQTISDKLEIICINDDSDDRSNFFKEYSEKFFNLIHINTSSDDTFYSSLIKASGEFVLITDTNQLCSEDYSDKTTLETIYKKASDNDIDMLIYNINKKEAQNKHNKFIFQLLEKSISPEDLTKQQIISLCELDCDILYFNMFKLYDYENENLEHINVFKLENLLNSRKIFLMNSFSSFKTINDKAILENKNDSNSEIESKYDDIKSNQKQYITPLSPSDFNTLISIIIPTYNTLRNNILQALYSIFNQTFDFNKLEIIFINDSSTFLDGIDIISKFSKKYPNIHLYHTTVNSGVGLARNLGLSKAKGKYVMFLDQNDYYMENACKLLYDTITKYDIDVVSGNFFNVRNNKSYIGWNLKDIKDKITLYEDIEEKSKICNFPPSIGTKIYAKDFLDQNNIKFPDCRIAEDKIFFYNILFSKSKLLFINEPIYIHELRNGTENEDKSLTLQYTFKNLLRILEVDKNIFKLFEKRAPQYNHIILDDVIDLTDFLLNTPLNYEEFRVFADKSYDFYKDFLENKKTNKDYEHLKFIKSLLQKNNIESFNQYKQLSIKRDISFKSSEKLISIIVNVYDPKLLDIGLNNIFNNVPFNIEIICINKCDDDFTDIIKKYEDKFYNIKLIDYKINEYFFNRKITSANGEYIVLTNLSSIISKDYILKLNEILFDSFENSYNLTIFNLKSFENKKFNQISEKISNQVLNTNYLTADELDYLYNCECEKIISFRFLVKTINWKINELSYEPITYMDLITETDNIYLPRNLLYKEKTLEKLVSFCKDNTDKNNKITEKIENFRKQVPCKIKEDEIIQLDNISMEVVDPKISIIIPVYNPSQKDIQKVLISLFNQTFKFSDLEIIFINDQSIMKSGILLIKEYASQYPNIKLLSTPVNSGSGIARNIGIDNAHGKYIMFLDHDDYYYCNACEILYNTIEQEDAMIVQGNYIEPDSKYYPVYWNKIGEPKYKTVTETIDEKKNFFKVYSVVWHFIIRKDYLDKEEIRFKNYKVAQDTLFHYTCKLKDNKIVFINEPIVFYEKRKPREDGEMSITLEKSLDTLLTRFKVMYDICEIFDSYAPEYKYIILNNANYLTQVLFDTKLEYSGFKKFVDICSQFYNDFLNNNKTAKPLNNDFFEFVIEKDYIKAFREYIKEKNT